jgi:LuxR family maltose regulon positive regulatory protein
MCGPLCDAMLGQSGSAAVLADLGRSNLLLVPLDRRGEWYRYHHLFRDMLLAELHRLEPGLKPVLQGHAARWCLHNGLPEEALEYAMAAGDVDTVAGLAASLGVSVYRGGRITTVQRWFGWLENHGGITKYPITAVMATLLAALTGHPADAERWASAVDHWQYGDPARPADPVAEAWAALQRAVLCRTGVEQMRADADEAARRFADQDIPDPAPALMQGIAHVLSGDLDRGDKSLEDAASIAQATGTSDVLGVALCERSLIAMTQGQWDRAEILASQARAPLRQAGIEESYVTPLACAAQARTALHRGDVPAARQQLVMAQRLRPVLTYAIPWLAVQTRIELACAHLALADAAGARTLLREVDELLRHRPALGTLVSQAQTLRTQLSKERDTGTPGASTLTDAELRLLPLLSTHLTFPEIGQELFLSRNTIKSQAVSIYRKLGVASRNQAVTRARELRILEG